MKAKSHYSSKSSDLTAILLAVASAFLVFSAWLASDGSNLLIARAYAQSPTQKPGTNLEVAQGLGLAPQSSDLPLTLDSGLRRPFIFLRDTANKAWPPLLLFLGMTFMASTCRFAAPKLTSSCLECCRKNFLFTTAAGIFYSSLLMIMARTSFRVETLAPMGILCIGLLQMSFLFGLAMAVNLLAAKIDARINTKNNYWLSFLSIMLASLLLTAVSTVPALGRLPRLGNRVLLTLAMIGAGSLVRSLKSRTTE